MFLNQEELTLQNSLAKLQYMINVYAKFQYNCSKTVGGVRDTKLQVFCTQTQVLRGRTLWGYVL